ncbi:hypothetical protein BpHYR1_007807 [Brachionus plicatilis]|uniref:Uncharacterized protein n=1 Tax=Brachionus plicatilis TaxID=10195 RepID=A0A3M7Q4A2_BRAPC|nr:hypothetical protein BpHYR1_007807 [Brachionus plicatilis]
MVAYSDKMYFHSKRIKINMAHKEPEPKEGFIFIIELSVIFSFKQLRHKDHLFKLGLSLTLSLLSELNY